MNSYQTTDHEEIAIDSVEGLAALLEFANDLLLEVNDLVKTADDDVRYHEAQDQAEVLFLKLQSLIERHTKVLDLGGYLTTDDTDAIQTLYDELAEVRDSLDDEETLEVSQPELEEHGSAPGSNAAKGIPITIAAPQLVTIAADSEEEESEEFIDKADEESKFVEENSASEENEVMSAVKQVSGSLQVRDESESVIPTGVSITATSIDTETVRRQLRLLSKTAEPLIQKAEAMQLEYKELTTVDEDDEDLKNGLYLYRELAASTAQVHELLEEVELRLKDPAKEGLDLFLANATNELAEYVDNLEGIDKGLEWYFDDIEGHPEGAAPAGQSGSMPPVNSSNVEKLYRPALFKKDELRPYIDAVVMEPEYKRFLSSRFASPTEFEAYLRREIISREEPSKLDKVLGIVHQSPFDSLLISMTLAELEQFDQQPVQSLRAALQEKDIQYEFYVDWLHTYPIMKHMINPPAAMTFGELFVRAMVEDAIDQAEAST